LAEVFSFNNFYCLMSEIQNLLLDQVEN
jgi:hypothetical protein